MSGLKIRRYVEGALEKSYKRYQKNQDKFIPYLASLQNNQDFEAFISDLYGEQTQLGITVDDIKDFLDALADQQEFKKLVGIQFYRIWLEFYIMDYGEIKERFVNRELENFPTDSKKQLDRLKAICIAYIASGKNGSESELLKSLNQHPIFQQFLRLIQNKSSMKEESPTKLIKISRLISSVKNNADQGKIIVLLVKKIIDKIGVLEKIQFKHEKIQEIKEFFDAILEKNNMESQFLRIDLRQVILNILHIDIRPNVCIVREKTAHIIEQSFASFNQFYKCSLMLIDMQQKKTTVGDFMDYFERILLGSKSAWLWPTLSKSSLILLLRNMCLDNKNSTARLNQLLNKYPPNMLATIYNLQRREFFHEVLLDIPEVSQKGFFARNILNISQSQRINLEKPILTGQTYFDMLQQLGVPIKHLTNYQSLIQTNNSCFFIFDKATKKNNSLYLSKEDQSQLIEKIINPHKYIKGQLSTHQYHMEYTITDKQLSAYYKASIMNNYCRKLQCQGPLFYSNIADFGDKVKAFQWKIVKPSGEIIENSPEENDKIGEEIFRIIKTKDDNKLFVYKANNQKCTYSVNAENLEVMQYITAPQNKLSQVKQKLGFLIYIPSYKGKVEVQQVIEESQDFVEIPIRKDARPKQNLKDTVEDVEEQEDKVVTFHTSFKYLGVFKPFFEIHGNNYLIDNRKNVNVPVSCKKEIDYFQRWQELTTFELLNKFLLPSNAKKEAPNKDSTFKLPRLAYSYTEDKLNQFKTEYKRQVAFRYDPKAQLIKIENMVASKQASQFFGAIFEYYALWAQQYNDKKSFILKVNKDQERFLQESRIPGIKIRGKNGSNIQIQCSKEDKQKLQMDLQTLDEINDFIYDNVEAYMMMKDMQKEYLEEIKLVEGDKTDQSIKLSYKLRYYPSFNKKYKHYCDMIAERPSEEKQLYIPNDSDFIHIYRSEMEKEDPSISVSKMGKDILLQYDSKLEKRVQIAVKRIQELKQNEIFDISRRSGKEYNIKGISQQFLFRLKDRLEALLKEKAGQLLQPQIKVDHIPETEYSLTGIQISEEHQKYLFQLISKFEKNFKQYNKIKFQINDTQQHFNRVFAKIPQAKYKGLIAKLNKELKVKLGSLVLEIVQSTTASYNKRLQQQFLDYLSNTRFDNLFQSKLSQQSKVQLTEKTQKIDIFSAFLIDKIEESEKASTVKNAAIKGIICKQTEKLIKSMNLQYKASKLTANSMQRYYKSLNILTTIYYGPQLPITSHLQDIAQLLQKNNVVMVKVGTGSGKSTVIPPYLVGKGYKKVVVTQPRRLPCREIYKRISGVFGQGISGYEVGDGKKDAKNNLIYMTDGLLKMRAIFDETVFDNIDVLVIDQIHERSANIDILLLLLFEYFRKAPRKLKLILCSATIDKQIGKIMEDAKLKVGLFEPQIPNRFTITEHQIIQGTIIETIVKLSRNLKNNEQLLAFFPGVNEVITTVKILLEKYNLLAYAITANQNAKVQQENIQSGRVFISTAIAETSLTFRNLKYVIDSRLSRWRTFDPELEMMKTDEDYSSNSSIKQRKGRVGRTCNGEYHYYVYQDFDFTANREHNPTELQKNDFTNIIFQLLLREGSRFQQVVALLKKLNHDPTEFDKKVGYSLNILQDTMILKVDGTLIRGAQKLLNYGNLGNPQHNLALDQASRNGCYINMAYLIAFQMFGTVVTGKMIQYCKVQYKGGDLKVLHDFLVDVGNRVNIAGVPEKQLADQMKIKCRNLMGQPWYNILVKIMKKTKELLVANKDNMAAPANQWDTILKIFIQCYSNKIFFNQSLFGGSKNLFQKLRGHVEFNYQDNKPEDNQQSKVTFKIDLSSLISSRDNMPSAMISLNCSISPQNQCILSVCEEVNLSDIRQQINISISGSQCDKKFIEGPEPVDQRKVFDELSIDIRSKYNRVATILSFPKLKMSGYFNDLVEIFAKTIQPKRKNPEIKVDLKKMVESAVDARQLRIKHDNMAPIIEKQHTMILLEKLTFQDYKYLFSTMKYEMKNDYEVAIQWDQKQSKIKIKQAKNIILSKILLKLSNFARWFSDCQLISKEQYKIKPQYIGDCFSLNKDIKKNIMDRVNNLVDSKMPHYILKSWCSGRGPSTKFPRTARMIAVSWVLINLFDCVVKGGFVRDWIVNGEEVVPVTVKQRKELLQNNPRNKFLEVIDDSVTPSDIDVEMSPNIVFNCEAFLKEMKKLGISTKIEEDGWRKHIIFDNKTESGGFTADLIEPYTSLTHYTYDFDVNVMYVKKDHLNSIGMKIPLVYENELQNKKEKVDLDRLLIQCTKKQMVALKKFIPQYRFIKFQSRKWTISKGQLFQPICYKSLFTQSFPVPPEDIQKVNRDFYDKIVVGQNRKIVRIEQLSNKGWDDAFESAQHWIINELEAAAKAKDPANYNPSKINSNNKVLFHGTRDANGATGIKLSGFDSRYYATGCMYGRGAYFAQDPLKSHDYTGPGPIRHMFIVNVALGNQENMAVTSNNKTGPSKGYHSILGTAGKAKEYIIDRWGQAKPLFLIVYQ